MYVRAPSIVCFRIGLLKEPGGVCGKEERKKERKGTHGDPAQAEGGAAAGQTAREGAVSGTGLPHAHC